MNKDEQDQQPEQQQSSCCPPGSHGFAPYHPTDYASQGQVMEVGNNLSAYMTGNHMSEKCILLFSDVYGIHSGRHLWLADQLAHANDCCVVAPDFFRGCPPFTQESNVYNSFQTLIRHFKYSDLRADIMNVYSYCRGVPSRRPRQVAAVGLCYGAYLWTFAIGLGGVDVSCFVGLHPAILGMTNGTQESWELAVGQIRCPVGVWSAGHDPAEQQPGGRMHQILLLRQSAVMSCEFHSRPDLLHGWMVRGGDWSVENDPVRRGTFQVLQQVITFLHRHWRPSTTT